MDPSGDQPVNVEQYIVRTLSADPSVAALAGARVFSELAPQDETKPHVVIGQSSREDDVAMDGPTGVGRVMVEVTCWASRRRDSSALARAVRAVLSSHSGGAEGLDVQGCFPGSESWDFDAERKLYATSREWEVWASGAES